MRNKGCRNAADLEAILGSPVLTIVPAMLSAQDRRKAQARRRILILALAAVVFAGLALAIWAAL